MIHLALGWGGGDNNPDERGFPEPREGSEVIGRVVVGSKVVGIGVVGVAVVGGGVVGEAVVTGVAGV